MGWSHVCAPCNEEEDDDDVEGLDQAQTRGDGATVARITQIASAEAATEMHMASLSSLLAQRKSFLHRKIPRFIANQA